MILMFHKMQLELLTVAQEYPARGGHNHNAEYTTTHRGIHGISDGEHRWQRCGRVLKTSQVHFSWEGRHDGRQRCRKRYRSPEQVELDLSRLAQLRGRDVRIVFLGDSRIRVLHEWLAKRLELHQPPANRSLHYAPYLYSEELLRQYVPSAEKVPPEQLPAGCVEANLLTATPLVRCSLLATGARLRSEFWWRPYLDDRFAERLDQLLAECAAGRCPDVTVLDAGTWSSVVYASSPLAEHPAPRRVALFAAALAGLQERLRRLAAVTRLLWKVDEPFTPEVALGRKYNRTGGMMVTTAAVYQTLQRVPGVTLWSTGITEWLQFYHGVCRPHWQLLRDTVFDSVRFECSDPMHVGSTVRWKLLQSLFNVLFQGEEDSTDDFCCA